MVCSCLIVMMGVPTTPAWGWQALSMSCTWTRRFPQLPMCVAQLVS